MNIPVNVAIAELSEDSLRMIAKEVVKYLPDYLPRQPPVKHKVNITEAAKYCNVAPSTFNRWRKNYESLKAIEQSVGGTVRFDTADLDKFMRNKY